MINANLILNLVKELEWQDVLALMDEKKIKVKVKGDLAIFNYNIGADFSDPVVCQARGIIIDTKNQKVVCRGFDKFFNFSEPYASSIDWNSAKVQEKIDGSIIKLYKYDGYWRWATNGMIDSFDADVADGLPVTSFEGIIMKCVNYRDILYRLNSLDENNTYIFELVSPYNRVVISYKEPKLYHIGTRNNLTGQEYDIDIGIKKPKKYPLNTLDECIMAASVLNKDQNNIDAEGFVVVDKHFNRVKIKSPEYVYLHHNLNNHTLSIKRIIELMENEDFNIDSFLKEFPEYQERFDKIRGTIKDFYKECRRVMTGAREMYAKNGNRRVVFETFGVNKDIGFAAMMAVGNDIPYEELEKRIDKKKVLLYVSNKLKDCMDEE